MKVLFAVAHYYQPKADVISGRVVGLVSQSKLMNAAGVTMHLLQAQLVRLPGRVIPQARPRDHPRVRGPGQ